VSPARRPRLAVLYPHELIGENAGLIDLHVRSLEQLLEPLGWSVDARTTLDPGFAATALGADVAVVQMLGAPEVEAVIRLRRAQGRPTVFEITDNPVGVGDWLPRTHVAHSPLARQGVLFHAHLSDALQMLVPALAELFASVHPRRIVLDPYVPYPEEVPRKPPGFVVGWAGSRSHAASLELAAPAVVELCRRHRDVTFAFMGHRSMFDELFGAIAADQADVHPFGDQAEHLRFTGRLHVGLAPMSPSPFNATRSDTRVCVYAGQGVAGVLEDAPAHRRHADHARIYRTPQELLATLDELYADRAQVERLARRARAWLERERSADALGRQRDRAYRGLLDAAPAAPPAGPPAPRDEAGLARRLAAASAREPDEALVLCRELVAEAPGYDQAHVAVARCLEALGRHGELLDHVDAVTPSPIYADVLAELAVRAARRVRPGAEQRYHDRVRSPFRRARLASSDSPAASSRAVLEHQPYDHFALASTIHRMRRDDPSSAELAALYERACLVAPQEVPADRRPARLAPFLPA
jgi:hypothetical protein